MIDPKDIVTPFKATYPLEHICFYPIELPTREGDVYAFAFVDVFSKFLFITGIEKERNQNILMRHFQKLFNEPDFTTHYKGLPLTLFVHKQQMMPTGIEPLLKTFKACLMVSDPYVTKTIAPVMKQLFENFKNE